MVRDSGVNTSHMRADARPLIPTLLPQSGGEGLCPWPRTEIPICFQSRGRRPPKVVAGEHFSRRPAAAPRPAARVDARA